MMIETTFSTFRRWTLHLASCAAITALAGCVHFGGGAYDFPAVAPTVRAVTHGPAFHWFGYYDVRQFDPDQHYLLGMEVGFQHRTPTSNDIVKIGMIDLRDGDRWIELGESRAWCWQQGCRLQWRPGSRSEVVWNDREGDHFVCRVLDVTTRKERTLPCPVYDISPDGKIGLGTDFARLHDVRPGYGYAGITDGNADLLAPGNSGIYAMDMDTGAYRFLFSIADVANIQYQGRPPTRKLCFNHIKWSPDGKRFLFYCHEIGRNANIFGYTAAADGSDIRLIADQLSHYTWRDAQHLLLFSRDAFRLYDDDASQRSEIVWRRKDGHASYLPDKEWIVADTYPLGAKQDQVLALFHVASGRTIELGRFRSPREYKEEWRCDLHPRVSPDGKMIAFDSAHAGSGRQIYLMDLRPMKEIGGGSGGE
jgi:hypothetical protein